jgi:DNA-binding transcriptional LysR family regulator
LIGRRAGKLAHALYGATTLLGTHGLPALVADLSRFKVCTLSRTLQHHTSATWWSKAVKTPLDVALIANTEMGLAAAIAAGAGVGVLPCFLGDRLSGVARIPAIAIGPPVDIWIVTHAALRTNAVVRALLRTLATAMQRDAAALAGRAARG